MRNLKDLPEWAKAVAWLVLGIGGLLFVFVYLPNTESAKAKRAAAEAKEKDRKEKYDRENYWEK